MVMAALLPIGDASEISRMNASACHAEDAKLVTSPSRSIP